MLFDIKHFNEVAKGLERHFAHFDFGLKGNGCLFMKRVLKNWYDCDLVTVGACQQIGDHHNMGAVGRIKTAAKDSNINRLLGFCVLIFEAAIHFANHLTI
jgi:hypothetical protein